jgi:hypothetical protein
MSSHTHTLSHPLVVTLTLMQYGVATRTRPSKICTVATGTIVEMGGVRRGREMKCGLGRRERGGEWVPWVYSVCGVCHEWKTDLERRHHQHPLLLLSSRECELDGARMM